MIIYDDPFDKLSTNIAYYEIFLSRSASKAARYMGTWQEPENVTVYDDSCYFHYGDNQKVQSYKYEELK